MKKAKPEAKDEEALEERNAPCESQRVLGQVAFPKVFDEVSVAVLPEHQKHSSRAWRSTAGQRRRVLNLIPRTQPKMARKQKIEHNTPQSPGA